VVLRILNAGPDPEVVARRIREAIEGAIPGARALVRCASPGHFEIEVTAEAFAGRPRVKQHQMVYAAITPLMSGDAAPVHAVDRLDCLTPPAPVG
jgi:acid stress-induced BolA-like protein IbaG/YrbA